MTLKRLVGLALIVGGIIVFIIGLNATDSFSDRFSHFFSGHFTDQTVWYMIGGVTAFIIGIGFLPDGGSKSTA